MPSQLMLATLLCLLPLGGSAFVPVPRTREDFYAQRRDRLADKFRTGDIDFALRHYNDDFMHSDGGALKIELLKSVVSLEVFTRMVDQTDPDVLVRASGLSPEKAVIVKRTLEAYQEVVAGLRDGNINEIVEELVTTGALSEAGCLKFLPEHIKDITDNVLSRFPPALIRKLMVGTERLDGVVQTNFLRWINDLPYFTEIGVNPETLISAISRLCSEDPPNMPLIGRLVEEAPSSVLHKFEEVPLIAQRVAGLLSTSKALEGLFNKLCNVSPSNLPVVGDIGTLLSLRPSIGVLLECFEKHICDSQDIVNFLLDAATPAQLHRLSRTPIGRFPALMHRILQERVVRLREGMQLYSCAISRAPSAVVAYISEFLGTDCVIKQRLKSFYKAADPKGVTSHHEVSLIRLVRLGATDDTIIKFLEKNDQLKNCRMFVAYANEVGPDLSAAVVEAFFKAHKNAAEFSSKMAALLPMVRSSMLAYLLNKLPVQYKDTVYWVSFLRTTSQLTLFFNSPAIYPVYLRLHFEHRIQEALLKRAGSFFEAAKSGNLEAIKGAFDRCEPYLHPSTIERAYKLTRGHLTCQEYLERFIERRSDKHLPNVCKLRVILEEENPNAKQALMILKSLPVGAQYALIISLFEKVTIRTFNVTLPKLEWLPNTKRVIKWFDLKAVEIFTLRCRSFGLTARHKFMKTLMQLRPDLRSLEVVVEQGASSLPTQAASLPVVEE